MDTCLSISPYVLFRNVRNEFVPSLHKMNSHYVVMSVRSSVYFISGTIERILIKFSVCSLHSTFPVDVNFHTCWFNVNPASCLTDIEYSLCNRFWKLKLSKLLARSNVSNDFGLWNTVIMCSNITRALDVYLFFYVISCPRNGPISRPRHPTKFVILHTFINWFWNETGREAEE